LKSLPTDFEIHETVPIEIYGYNYISNGFIYYNEELPLSRFFLSQKYYEARESIAYNDKIETKNSCVALSIMNALIKNNLTTNMHIKQFVDLYNSLKYANWNKETNDRVSICQMVKHHLAGYSFKYRTPDEIPQLINEGKTLIIHALNYFGSHSMLVTGLAQDEESVFALDTMTGLEVEIPIDKTPLCRLPC
jgi:hypothetical protein